MIDPKNVRVVVSCKGDVEVLDFPSSDGVAWVLLRDGPSGEPGRKSDTEAVDLSEACGVLIGMKDPRSAQALIDAFSKAKAELESADDALRPDCAMRREPDPDEEPDR